MTPTSRLKPRPEPLEDDAVPTQASRSDPRGLIGLYVRHAPNSDRHSERRPGNRTSDDVAAEPSRVAFRRQGRFDLWRRARRQWLFALAVFMLLAGMAVAMVSTAVQQTPTIDEPVYVGTAVVQQQQHSLRYNPEHPPLGKLIIGTGTAFADPRLDPAFAGDQTALGRHLLYESGNDPSRLMLSARLPVIVLTLLFGLVVFAFARELVGPVGGLLALALYVCSPDVIAHGSLATLDVPAAGFLLTSVWLLWRARSRPLSQLSLAGLAFGAALATKMSALPAVPVVLLLSVVSVWYAARRTPHLQLRGKVRLLALGLAAPVAVVLIAVTVVWASYLTVDPLLRWATPGHVPVVRGLRGLVVDRLPFPEPYLDGMRIQFGFEDSTFNGFLFGRHYHGSLWYYLPAALLVKTPLGMLALWLAGAVAITAVPRLRPASLYVLVPAVVLLAAAMDGARNFGVRYAVSVPILLAVAAAGVVAAAGAAGVKAGRRQWTRIGAAVLLLFVAVSSVRTYPYYLPYSNEAFGGPSKTHLHLHDSNVDWGQDLGRLADRLRQRYPHQRVWLAYQGSGVPSAYGIRASDPRKAPANRVHGLLVVSDSLVAKAEGRLAALIDSGKPIDEVGHSITIYRRP
jgi:4-amino-4-deoxy-L-arabinose transferase-like glycosyltransferase